MAHLIHIALLFVAFASYKTLAKDLNTVYGQLPDCEFDMEVQFYTSEIDVSGLPEGCYESIDNIDHLTTIGFIIQVCAMYVFIG